MSAITGILYRDGRYVNPEQIKKMNDKLVHRGLNGSKTWCEGSVALGHQMLFTTQESLHEELPFVDKETGLVITADARIDNRKELSEILDLEDNEITPDSQFIIKAYEKWGEDCPKKLLGDFAFAIWNTNKEELFCARDHMGVKPFYYYVNEDIFVFATEIKALFDLIEVPLKINKLMVLYYFIPSSQEKVLTFYEDILRLPSASILKSDCSDFVIKSYWRLDPNLEIQLDSEEAYITEFKRIFNEAVKCRLRSAYPIGSELSGGLDSSSVVCVAKKNFKNSKNIDTFSLITNFEDGDERFYIQKVVDSGGVNPYFLLADEVNVLKDLKKIICHSDRPIAAANITNFWNLYKIMQENNIRILLSGVDGDSVLSHGKNYLKELFLTFQFQKLYKELVCISKIKKVKIANIFLSQVIFNMIPTNIKNLLKKNDDEGYFMVNNIILDEKLDFKQKYDDFNKCYDGSNYETAKGLHYFMINQTAHQNALEVRDSLTAAFYIEERYPFYDKRLIEFCYGIPTEIKFKFGWSRYLLRESMNGILPEEIQWRHDKKFFSSVLDQNVLRDGKSYLDEIFYKKNDQLAAFFELNDLQKLYEDYKKGSEYKSSINRYDIWNLITFNEWLKQNDDL